jgi:hypothetical protein
LIGIFPSPKSSDRNADGNSYDGQAGAAALTLDAPEALFMKDLYAGLKKTGLASYAMPRLVRITKEYISPFSPTLSLFPPFSLPNPQPPKKNIVC